MPRHPQTQMPIQPRIMLDEKLMIELSNKYIETLFAKILMKKFKEKYKGYPETNPSVRLLSDQDCLFIHEKLNREEKNKIINTLAEFYRDHESYTEHFRNIFLPEDLDNIDKLKKEIKTSNIREFIQEENARLEQSVPQELRGRPSDEFLSKFAEKTKTSALTNFINSCERLKARNVKYNISSNEFFDVIRDYTSQDDNLHGLSNEKKKESKEIIKRLLDATTLIGYCKDSLDYLSHEDLLGDDHKKTALIKFMYSACHIGDIKGLKTLQEKLGEGNFATIFYSMPIAKENHEHAISINGILSIIDKRRKGEDKPDGGEWSMMHNLISRYKDNIVIQNYVPVPFPDSDQGAKTTTRVRGIVPVEDPAGMRLKGGEPPIR